MQKIKLEASKKKPRKHIRLPNNFGSVVTLSGNRRRPFQARKTLGFDEKAHPIYKTIGYFEEWMDAYNALVIYNENNGNSFIKYEHPIAADNDILFEEVYKKWYHWKYRNPNKKLSESSENCTRAAYKKCHKLYSMKMSDIKSTHMQDVLDDDNLSHATMEHVCNLFKQMSKYAFAFDMIQKDYSDFITINKMDDDESGVPFSAEDIDLLWTNIDIPYVDTILIFIYTGWRANELLKMPLRDISLENQTLIGGNKTRSGKSRIVPIHSKIFCLIEKRYLDTNETLFAVNGKSLKYPAYRRRFKEALSLIGLNPNHTPHDCRHTFSTMLSNADADPLARKLLLGHNIADLTDRVYTHKDINFLRNEIEKI